MTKLTDYTATEGNYTALCDDVLFNYASGNCCHATDIIAGSYVALSESARQKLKEYEAIGGALIETECELEPVSENCFDQIMAKIDSRESEGSATALNERKPDFQDFLKAEYDNFPEYKHFPKPLQYFISLQKKPPKWKFFMPGIQYYRFPVAADQSSTLTLMRLDPDVKTPAHDHHGVEMTLILDGAFHDKNGSYQKGELIISDETVHHQPIADKIEGCICLVMNQAPIKFTGPLTRFLNIFQ